MSQVTSKPSAINNLNRRTEKVLKVGVILLVVGGFISFLLLALAQQQLKRITTLNQELESVSQSQISVGGLQQFIATQQADIDRLVAVFPNEDTIITFVSQVEAAIAAIDSQGEMSFSTLEPVKVSNELTIPLLIRLEATPLEAVELLKRLEQLPYIIKISSVEMYLPTGTTGKGEISIGASAYVADPFR